jgi:predicted esterase
VIQAGTPLEQATGALILLHGRGGSAEDMVGIGSALSHGLLILLGHKRTFSCRIVLWDHGSLRQAHKRDASRHI